MKVSTEVTITINSGEATYNVTVTGALISSSDLSKENLFLHYRVPKVRMVPKQFPTEERYLDYDCYYRTWQKYSCYKIRHSFRYDYVTEVGKITTDFYDLTTQMQSIEGEKNTHLIRLKHEWAKKKKEDDRSYLNINI